MPLGWVRAPARPVDDDYVEVPGATGESTLESDVPYPVTIVPSDLVS